jgi:hypothetical protein
MRRLMSTTRRTREASRRVALRAGGAALALATAVSLAITTSAAQAVVLDMNSLGQSSVTYNPANQSGYYGVALVPGTNSFGEEVPGAWSTQFASSGIPAVTSSATCTDPALSPDLVLPSTGLCSHNGGVIHSNQTFALTWDQPRRYWATTRNYVEKFLRDVAADSGTLNSPYADTTQYTDGYGHAGNASVYGGGCVDFGSAGGFTCKFGDTSGSGAGNDYPANGCTPTGLNRWYEYPDGTIGTDPNQPNTNDLCLTDAQIQSELAAMVPATGMLSHTKPGYTPLVVLLTPPGVETCLNAAGTLCSANAGLSGAGAPAARFCSYHGQVNVNGTEVAYVVQPWVASWHNELGCDDPGIQQIPIPVPVDQLASDVGQRLVSPLSQGHIAAITDPGLNGWFNNATGAEVNDNGCIPWGNNLDSVTVGSGSYYLQREFNNAGAIESDPNALKCLPNVLLAPTFVAPSAVNQGDVVQLDGSTTVSSLIVPKANYAWNFGDGTTAVGPSVAHSYGTAGTYNVSLTVTDRGGNKATAIEQVVVLGPSGQVVPSAPVVSTGGVAPPTTQPVQGGSGASTSFQARLQLRPQSLRSVLRSGLSLRVSSNRAANGILSISISRAAAKRAHIKVGRGANVVIARGTTAGIRDGVVSLRLGLPRAIAAKLKHLGRVTLTVRLSLVAAGGARRAVDAAGRY